MPAIERLRDRKDVAGLIAVLSKKADFMTHLEAIKALGEIGQMAAEGPLIERLDDQRLPVREAAARALGMLRSQNAVEALSRQASAGGLDAGAARGTGNDVRTD